MSNRSEDYGEENPELEDAASDPLVDGAADVEAIESLRESLSISREDARRLWELFKRTVSKMKQIGEQ